MGSHRERVSLALARSFCFPNLIGLYEVIENRYELSHACDDRNLRRILVRFQMGVVSPNRDSSERLLRALQSARD